MNKTITHIVWKKLHLNYKGYKSVLLLLDYPFVQLFLQSKEVARLCPPFCRSSFAHAALVM